jgi:hypothetical protein
MLTWGGGGISSLLCSLAQVFWSNVPQEHAVAGNQQCQQRDCSACLSPAVLQMRSGFSRLLSAADDLVLDIPEAVHLLSLFLGRYAHS